MFLLKIDTIQRMIANVNAIIYESFSFEIKYECKKRILSIIFVGLHKQFKIDKNPSKRERIFLYHLHIWKLLFCRKWNHRKWWLSRCFRLTLLVFVCVSSKKNNFSSYFPYLPLDCYIRASCWWRLLLK